MESEANGAFNMIPEFKLDWKASKSERDAVADAVGRRFKTMTTDQICSDLIHNHIIQYFYGVSRDIDKPLSELLNDERLVKAWHYNAYIFEAINVMMSNFEQNCDVVFDEVFRRCGAEGIPHAIAADLMSFSAWAIIHGATAESIRINVQTKSYQNCVKWERKLGKSAFVSVLLRAACAYLSLHEKVIKPAFDKLIQGRNDNKINSMASAMRNATIKKRENHG